MWSLKKKLFFSAFVWMPSLWGPSVASRSVTTRSVFRSVWGRIRRHPVSTSAAVGCSALLGWFGYNWFQDRKNKAVEEELLEAFKVYQKSFTPNPSPIIQLLKTHKTRFEHANGPSLNQTIISQDKTVFNLLGIALVGMENPLGAQLVDQILSIGVKLDFRENTDTSCLIIAYEIFGSSSTMYQKLLRRFRADWPEKTKPIAPEISNELWEASARPQKPIDAGAYPLIKWFKRLFIARM